MSMRVHCCRHATFKPALHFPGKGLPKACCPLPAHLPGPLPTGQLLAQRRWHQALGIQRCQQQAGGRQGQGGAQAGMLGAGAATGAAGQCQQLRRGHAQAGMSVCSMPGRRGLHLSERAAVAACISRHDGTLLTWPTAAPPVWSSAACSLPRSGAASCSRGNQRQINTVLQPSQRPSPAGATASSARIASCHGCRQLTMLWAPGMLQVTSNGSPPDAPLVASGSCGCRCRDSW